MITWYIGFNADYKSKYKIHEYLRSPFHHCYCFREISPHTYYANPTFCNIDTKIYSYRKATPMAEYYASQPDTIILEYTSDLDLKIKMWHLGNVMPTCVSVVKMFLGINNFCLTPYSLYKWLLKNGAKQVE